MSTTTQKQAPTVILAGAYQLERDVLADVLHRERGMTIITSVREGKQLLRLAQKHKPDLLMLDLNLPDRNGLVLCEQLLQGRAQQKVLLLAESQHEEYVVRAQRLGTVGYIFKTDGIPEFLKAICRVWRDDPILLQASSGTENVASRHPENHHSQLTDRQFALLCELATGRGIQEVAERLGISPTSVYPLRRRLFHKLAIKNNVELIQYALQHKLIFDRPHLITDDKAEEKGYSGGPTYE